MGWGWYQGEEDKRGQIAFRPNEALSLPLASQFFCEGYQMSR